jgi:protein tyrosine phosphatase (PTP) superfamily phosphohydrolase (DUF442 family)
MGLMRINELRGEVLQNCKRSRREIVQDRLVRYVLLVSLLAAGCRTMQPFVCDTTPHQPRNFGVVSANVYRGGQPMTCGELAFLQSHGVKSILKLNDRDSPVDVDEKNAAASLGLRMESIPFNALTIGEPDSCPDVQRALAFLEEPSNWPVFVHCTAGKDRTGYIVGLYERTFLGRPVADVLAELHRYGHRGSRSLAFPQIDHELVKERPACAR